jgi:glycosyltransferase involved in cell wall biosynthesis
VTWSARSLARALRDRGVDLVHAHAEHAAHCATEAAYLAGIPLVVATFHTRPGFDARGTERERLQWAGRSANVYVSEAVRRDHLVSLDVDGDRSFVIRNGIDVERFSVPPPPARLAALRRELGLNGSGPVLLNVARLQRIKAPEDLLAAFAEVRRRIPGAVLVMAGGGRRQAEVLGLIRALGLVEHVRLPGTRADVGDLYHLADLHVMASRGEGFSLVVLEAMAAGLPQVLTAVGGTPEAIEASGAARLVPAGEPGRLAQAIAALLRDEPERRRMGEAAKQRARRFSIAEQVVRMERLYDSLATGTVALAR